jgi:hypothetical protein
MTDVMFQRSVSSHIYIVSTNSFFMRPNMLMADRLIRTIIALTFIALCLANVLPFGVASLLLIVAIIFLVTSFTGYCPFYWLFGFRGTHHAGK